MKTDTCGKKVLVGDISTFSHVFRHVYRVQVLLPYQIMIQYLVPNIEFLSSFFFYKRVIDVAMFYWPFPAIFLNICVLCLSSSPAVQDKIIVC